MNIEIANRLVNLRKKNGLSQEELAAKLGLSRQAVSKWERAEASPDTDNLICLAKLYGVSLDDLLKTDDNIDTIVKEQTKESSSHSEEDEDKKNGEDVFNDDSSDLKERVYIGPRGIHVKDGGDEVHIGPHGIFVKDSDGSEVNLGSVSKFPGEESNKLRLAEGIVTGSLLFLITAAYVVCGCLISGVWSWGWVAFFLVPLTGCIFETARCKTFASFTGAVVFLSCITFFALGYSASLWHPGWAVFLAIPFYAIIGESIDKCLQKSLKIHKEGSDEKEVIDFESEENQNK